MADYLSREAILDADDLPTQDVAVPEWGGTVRVRALSGAERDKLEAAATKNGKLNLDNFSAKLAAAAIVDAEGNRVFSEADVAKLGRKSAAALNRVSNAVRHLSAITEADVEELAGN